MSQFLAPVHTWLFNKILVLEEIEQGIVNGLDSEDLKAKYNQLKEAFGEPLPNKPLEEMIDESNIHGWLQEKITKAESRQAALVSVLMEGSSDAIEGVKNVYHQTGIRVAARFSTKVNEPSEIYSALNNVLLEGMPCDRVNQVVEQSDDKMVWKTATCVHKNNWESNGVDVAYFYSFRAAFTKGFVETLSANCTYTYTNETEQLHTISK